MLSIMRKCLLMTFETKYNSTALRIYFYHQIFYVHNISDFILNKSIQTSFIKTKLTTDGSANSSQTPESYFPSSILIRRLNRHGSRFSLSLQRHSQGGIVQLHSGASSIVSGFGFGLTKYKLILLMPPIRTFWKSGMCFSHWCNFSKWFNWISVSNDLSSFFSLKNFVCWHSS